MTVKSLITFTEVSISSLMSAKNEYGQVYHFVQEIKKKKRHTKGKCFKWQID
jgi:hypothetical protein